MMANREMLWFVFGAVLGGVFLAVLQLGAADAPH